MPLLVEAARPSGTALEPLGEPAAAAGVLAALRRAAEAALAPLRALLDDSGLLPQQALGQLDFVETALNMILAHLQDPDGQKFQRMKLSAVRKRIQQRPEHAEALLKCGGFAAVAGPTGGPPEHFEWGSAEALPSSLALLVLVRRVRARGCSAAGLRSLTEVVDTDITMKDLVALDFGCETLFEGDAVGAAHKAGVVKGGLIPRVWLEAELPNVASVMEDVRKSMGAGIRKMAITRALYAGFNDRRPDSAKFTSSPVLCRVAQFMSSVILVAMRRRDMCNAHTTPAEEALLVQEPDMEPICDAAEVAAADLGGGGGGGGAPAEAAAAVEAITVVATPEGAAPRSRQCGVEVLEADVLSKVMGCNPLVKAGLPHRSAKQTVYLREFPAFFTSGVQDTQFQVSLGELTTRLVEHLEPQLGSETQALGLGCSIDISQDDKAIVYAVAM